MEICIANIHFQKANYLCIQLLLEIGTLHCRVANVNDVLRQILLHFDVADY